MNDESLYWPTLDCLQHFVLVTDWVSCLIALILSSSPDYWDYYPLIVSSSTKTGGLCAKKLFLVSVSCVRSEICAGSTKDWAHHYSVVVRWSLSCEDSLLFITTPQTSVRHLLPDARDQTIYIILSNIHITCILYIWHMYINTRETNVSM